MEKFEFIFCCFVAYLEKEFQHREIIAVELSTTRQNQLHSFTGISLGCKNFIYPVPAQVMKILGFFFFCVYKNYSVA